MSTRVDLYRAVHRGLRALMLDTQWQLSRLDPLQPASRRDVLSQTRDLVRVCRVHLDDEQAVIHAAMDRRMPGATTAFDRDHLHHAAQLVRLEALAKELDVSPSRQAHRALEHELDAFVRESLEHMHAEEELLMPLLQATHSDPELVQLHHEIVQTIAPADFRLFTRWMVQGLPASERTAWLASVKREAPETVFDDALRLAREELPEAELGPLLAGLA